MSTGYMPTFVLTSWESDKKGFQCVSARSLKGLLVGVHASNHQFLEGGRYYLTRNVRGIVEAPLSKYDAIRQATLAYPEDIFIDENLEFAIRVKQYLVNFGQGSKKPKRL